MTTQDIFKNFFKKAGERKNRFHHLLRDSVNAPNKVKNEELDGDAWYGVQADLESGEIFIYDVIGWPWITALDVLNLQKKIKADEITVRINSYGGDVFEAFAIYNNFRTSEKPVNVIIDGVAASAASYIAMVGQKVTIAENAMLMIHNPWTITAGDSDDLRKEADVLDQVRDAIALTYAKRPDVDQEEVKQLMADETWLLGQAAVDAGFADETGEASVGFTPSDSISNIYSNVPKELSTPSGEGSENKKVRSADYCRRQQAIVKQNHIKKS